MIVYIWEIYRDKDRRGMIGYAANTTLDVEPEFDDPRDYPVLLGFVQADLIKKPYGRDIIRIADDFIIQVSEAANWIRSRVEGTGDSRAARALAG